MKRDGGEAAEILTQVQVCARLGISDECWRRWRRAKRTPEPVVMPSGRKKWRKIDIDRLVGQTGVDISRVLGLTREPQPFTGRYFQSVYRRHR